MSRLSIIIAAHNEERYLLEQLHAIRDQDVQPDEVILVDDASTDGTLGIMHDWGGCAVQQGIIPLPENVGCALATNIGADAATGDYLYIASANDVMQPGAVRAIAEAIKAAPDVPIVVGDLAGLQLGWATRPTLLAPYTLAALLGGRGIVHAAGAIVRHDVWAELGGWKLDVGPYADCLMWHTVACTYGGVYTPHPIAWVREGGTDRFGSIALDPYRRGPLLEAVAQHVMAMAEPGRSRLLRSGLWDIREFAPEMTTILHRVASTCTNYPVTA